MMELTSHLLDQVQRHPAMQPQDALKLCHQCAYGVEHLLSSPDNVRAYLYHECSLVGKTDEPLIEPIGLGMLRINLGAWNRLELPIEWLLRMFYATAREARPDPLSIFQGACMAVTTLAANGALPFSLSEWLDALRTYPTDAPVALHHSDHYRVFEDPHYRVVSASFRNALSVLSHLPNRKNVTVIAIDGRAASGKSTLAEQLRAITDCSIVHMDDFFLPAAKRTHDRLSMPGGNIDHERFSGEILPHLSHSAPFSYRIYSCQTGAFQGVSQVTSPSLRIVEGSYAHHPAFGEYAQLKVFLTVSEEEQARRLMFRNPSLFAKFTEAWIPMEERYFTEFAIRSSAHLTLSTDPETDV